jgi:hypothetical protein
MSKILYDLDPSQLVLIADDTYLYCEKSENSDTQRRLYSGQKKRHLIKPFVIVAENGVIIGIYGPFSATTNDAKILEIILKDDSALRNLLMKKDVMVLDRGFRDVIKCCSQESSSQHIKLIVLEWLLRFAMSSRVRMVFLRCIKLSKSVVIVSLLT